MTRASLTVLALCGAASLAGGDSLIPRGAEGIERADVSVFVGGGLGRESPTELQLFGGDPERARRFEAALRGAIAARLSERGISVVSGSSSGFAVAIFGRPISDGNCSRNAVLINFAVSNERYSASEQPVAERGVIETPTSDELEAGIQARVMMLLEEALKRSRPDELRGRPTRR
jgi:hypothetical protein